jgi:hypothetical protein
MTENSHPTNTASTVPLTSNNNNNDQQSTTTSSILYTAFRQKTIDMKHWVPLPESMPSVRQHNTNNTSIYIYIYIMYNIYTYCVF